MAFGNRLLHRVAVLALAFAAVAGPAVALEPDEIALLCNARVPASLDLAQYYAKTRGLPDGRIIELNLPEGEQMGAERFDPDVVVPVRKALSDRGLEKKVKCLVTFYGVPLILTPRRNRAEESSELEKLKLQHAATEQRLTAVVSSLENLVKKYDPTFHPSAALDVRQMLNRADIALKRSRAVAQSLGDPKAQQELTAAEMNCIAQIAGTPGLLRMTKPELLPMLTTRPATQPITQPYSRWDELKSAVEAADVQRRDLSMKRHDPAARKQLRDLADETYGIVELLGVLESQIDYLRPDEPTAFDSELSLLWLANYQHRAQIPNPLNFRNKQRSQSPALMVSRLDGPQSGTARDIVAACKQVEASGGLKGTMVIDSRGLAPRNAKGEPDGLGIYDQLLRDLATNISRNSSLTLVADDTPDIFKPPAKTVQNVSLYVGWYNLRSYVKAFTFVPGAVGFHVASYECCSLHNPGEAGWCRGLLSDGVVATLGAVDEPYLASFPNPNEFFPLLLTGKYTVAEAYWLTLPVASWKMVLVADPLYNPFKTNPAISPEKLSPVLHEFVSPPPAMPAPLPGLTPVP